MSGGKFVRVVMPSPRPESGTQMAVGTKVFLPDGSSIPGVHKVTLTLEKESVCRANIECIATVEVDGPRGSDETKGPVANLDPGSADRLAQLLAERAQLQNNTAEIVAAIQKLGDALDAKFGEILRRNRRSNLEFGS